MKVRFYLFLLFLMFAFRCLIKPKDGIDMLNAYYDLRDEYFKTKVKRRNYNE